MELSVIKPSFIKPSVIKSALLWLLLSLAPYTASAQTVLILGDSLSAAYNMRQEQGWGNLLQQKLDQKYSTGRYHVVNSSTSGDTTAGGLSRLPQLLEQHQPELVIIELGSNDGLRGLSLRQMKRNLTRMIELSHRDGALVVLAGMRLPPNYGERFTEKFRRIYVDLASEHGVALIPFFLEDVGGVSELTQADGLHPNAAAQPVILETAWPYIASQLTRQ